MSRPTETNRISITSCLKQIQESWQHSLTHHVLHAKQEYLMTTSFGGVRVAHLLVICVVLLCVVTFWVPCCDVSYDFRKKTMFSSSLPPVFCRRAHAVFTLFVFVCLLGVQHILCCISVWFFMRLVYPLFPVSLECHFFWYCLALIFYYFFPVNNNCQYSLT